MKHFIPTTRGLKTIEDNIQQCWVVWYHEGSSYNEFTGTEEECMSYIDKMPDKENYSIRYTEFD